MRLIAPKTTQPPAPDGESRDFAAPAPGDRRKIALTLAALVLGLALFHFLVFTPTLAWVRTLPVCEQAIWLSRMLLATMTLPSVLGLTVFLPMGLKAWRHRRWPYPGMWLWRRTPVRQGTRARLIAAMMVAWPLLAVPMPMFTWQVIAPLQQQACDAPQAKKAPSNPAIAPALP